jgi:hypothetical protein
MKQTKLEFDPVKILKRIRYLDLTIHERINIKANSCGFQTIWLNHAMPWFRKHLGIVTISDHPERLTDKWFWHHKTNDKRRLSKSTLF